MKEHEFQEKFRKLLESKTVDEMKDDDIIDIFDTKNNNCQSDIESFFEDDFIKLHEVHSKEDSYYYKVIHKDSLHLFLMKKFINQNLFKYQYRETNFCLNYSQRCFTKCYGLMKNKKLDIIGLIYEYMCNGTLTNFIKQYKNKITPLFSFMTMIRIFQAIKYLNMNRLIHRDLKPSNILIDHDFVPYIADNETVREINESLNFTANIGSMAYMPPEQYYNNVFSCESDIYSFGLIVYFLFEHEDLFSVYDKQKENTSEKLNMNNCTKNIKDICNSCLAFNLNDRIKNDELEDKIYNEIICSNHFQLYFTKEKCQEMIDFEVDKYLFENLVTLSEKNSNDFLKKYFYNMYYKICEKLAEVDKYKADAFNNLGNLFYCGIVVMKNYIEARKYYQLASQLNNSVSLNTLGDMFKKGIGVEQDYLKAKHYYELAAKYDNSESLYNLGYLYYNGYGVKKSVLTAKKFFEKSSSLNNTHGLNALGYLYVANVGIAQNLDKARECYEKALKLHNLNSYLNLAYLYTDGLGVPVDYRHAVKLYRQAAEKNHMRAIHHLGKMYKKGLGVELDLKKARELFEKAANLGNIDAFHSLGNLYLHGKGVPVDYEKARIYFLTAARYLNHSSLYKLGRLYEYGLGVKKDWEKAQEFYEKAADEGYYSAYINLANFFLNGEYFEVDEDRAISYYLKNISTNDEKVHFEKNGFYRTRKNFGYYPSHNDIGLIYLFKNDWGKAIKYLKEAAFSNYQFARNNYALLFDPSIEKDPKYFNDDFFKNYSKTENFKYAYEEYHKAVKLNFPLAEFNLAHMLDEEGDKESAIRLYELASEHEHYPLVFHSRERYDKRLIISTSFVIFYTDCKLFLEFSKSDLMKSKKYFLKILSRIQNENEIELFPYIKDLFLDISFLTDQTESKNNNYYIPNIINVKNKQIIINQNALYINFQKQKNSRKLIKENPLKLFNDMIENESNKLLFIQKIEEVASLMKDIIYTPPYQILFGRIIINEPKLKIMKKPQIQNINKYFYEGFGYDI